MERSPSIKAKNYVQKIVVFCISLSFSQKPHAFMRIHYFLSFQLKKNSANVPTGHFKRINNFEKMHLAVYEKKVNNLGFGVTALFRTNSKPFHGL